ncbi:MAG TPA: sigma-70 family RNA polymerase sigma factor [Kribbella sp.]|nr:sigma-70 family RNA polymerase sigma factor [Kribbella sp.]
MPDELLQRAREGDREAFAALVQPYRGELQLHCYRMLGSLQDAEDALQETLLSAWIGLSGFEGRSSVRTWLYRITTNRCLNVLRSSSRRPVPAVPLPVPAPEPTRSGEVLWLQPYPDVLLDGLPDQLPGPESRYESREAISLAFVTAVQLLPPNQRAVLLLRDVLGYRASETAELLGLTEAAVNSALARARVTMDTKALDRPVPADAEEQALTDRFVDAFTSQDVTALVALMTSDAWVRMPPLPFEYHGTEAAHRFFSALFFKTLGAHQREIAAMVPVRANRQPAWGEYARDPVTGALHLIGVLVIGIAGDRIHEITHFETTVASYFGLPRTLSDGELGQ